jgi:lysophospholipase L1-like esterase
MMKFLLLLLPVLFINEKILFVGDSITAYNDGWSKMITTENCYNAKNIAESSKGTGWMVDRLCNELNGNRQYSKVFIYGGINDMLTDDRFQPVSTSFKNIKIMIKIARKHNIEPIVICGYEPSVITNTWYNHKAFEKKIRDNYKMFQDSLMTLKDVKVIPPVKLLREDMADGIHPTIAGHRKLTEHIIKNMK